MFKKATTYRNEHFDKKTMGLGSGVADGQFSKENGIFRSPFLSNYDKPYPLTEVLRFSYYFFMLPPFLFPTQKSGYVYLFSEFFSQTNLIINTIG